MVTHMGEGLVLDGQLGCPSQYCVALADLNFVCSPLLMCTRFDVERPNAVW